MRKVTQSEQAERDLAAARDRAYKRVRKAYEDTLAEITAKYPALEREGWAKQEDAARTVKDGGSSTLITNMADKRGITESEMADKIIAKADAYADLYATATATLHNQQDEIESATTVDELNTIG